MRISVLEANTYTTLSVQNIHSYLISVVFLFAYTGREFNIFTGSDDGICEV